jgi:hypothetical protein
MYGWYHSGNTETDSALWRKTVFDARASFLKNSELASAKKNAGEGLSEPDELTCRDYTERLYWYIGQLFMIVTCPPPPSRWYRA